MFVQKTNQLVKHAGFTLLEVMIAAAFLGVGCLGVLAMLTTAQENNDTSASRTRGTVLAEQFISNMEAETRAVVKTPAPGGGNTFTYPTNTMLNSIATATVGVWVPYSRVNDLGQRPTGDGTPAPNLKFKYCIGYFSRNDANSALQTGALRVYWRKDGQEIAATNGCTKALLDNMDNMADARKNAKEYEFITLPFSISLDATRSETTTTDT